MASYTENILLTLREPTDPVEVDSFNRDNEIIDKILAPVAVDYAVLRSAARINAYNAMKAIRAASYAGIAVPEKNAMFFGDFDEFASLTSENALHCPEKHGYLFSSYQGDSFVYGEVGDVATEMGDSCAYSFTAPVSGYVTSMEVDVKMSVSNTDCYLMYGYFGNNEQHRRAFGATTTRGIRTYTFSEPIAVHKGDVISGRFYVTTGYTPGYVYGSALGEPYVKFNITPAMETGWVQTDFEPLGSMGHSEARAYIQCLKDENGVIGASLIDDSGDEVELEEVSSRTTVTKDGNTCIELCFTVPFSKESAALRIKADAGAGYADIYNYAVTVL